MDMGQQDMGERADPAVLARRSRQLEIEGLLISVDVAAALQPRGVVRYGDIGEDLEGDIAGSGRRRLHNALRVRLRLLRRQWRHWLQPRPRG
jgi:hypothetical protein